MDMHTGSLASQEENVLKALFLVNSLLVDRKGKAIWELRFPSLAQCGPRTAAASLQSLLIMWCFNPCPRPAETESEL